MKPAPGRCSKFMDNFKLWDVDEVAAQPTSARRFCAAETSYLGLDKNRVGLSRALTRKW
jgi:hypothetical protein